VTAWSDLRADLPSQGARSAIAAWTADERRAAPQPAWQDAEQDLLAALQVQPGNPTLNEALGDLYLLGGQQPWAAAPERQRYLQQSAEAYRQVLAVRPRDARNWGALTMALAQQGLRGPVVNAAWENAHRFGPNEGYLLLQQLRVALATWDDASPVMQKWATDLHENGTQQQRDDLNRLARQFGLEFSSESAPRAGPKAP
jgi:hypothetical protein